MRTRIQFALLSAALLTLVFAGCPATSLDNGGPPITAESSDVIDRGVVDVTQEDLPGGGTSPTVQFAGQVVGSDNPVKFHVDWTEGGSLSSYDALIGSGADGHVGNDGSFDLRSGWGLFIGHWPFIRTKRVSAGVEGSWLVVEIDGLDDATAVHRVYFVEGIEAWMRTDNGEEIRWRDTDIYFEIDPTGLVFIRNVSKSTQAKSFVNFVKDMAEQADYGRPPTTHGPAAGDEPTDGSVGMESP